MYELLIDKPVMPVDATFHVDPDSTFTGIDIENPNLLDNALSKNKQYLSSEEKAQILENLSITDNLSYWKNITYSELVQLRDDGKLQPGVQYRIIDYITTTVQENTRSAGHQFDIIVTADSENTINENVHAIQCGGYNEEQYNGKLGKDFFVEWGVTAEPNTGVDTLCVYKTDDEYSDEGTDYQDIFFYKGNYEYNGENFDVWQKYENDSYLIDDVCLHYYLTTPIVENGQIKPELYDANTKLFHEPFTAEYDLTINNINYFSNSNLNAWELKYSLDNDTTRFAWADIENGKGVIYYMKDEYGNECPYDFKNIQFVRKLEWFSEHEDWCNNVIGKVPTRSIYYYTFTYVDGDGIVHDASIIGNTLYNDEAYITGVYGNVIKDCSIYSMQGEQSDSYFALPSNIFYTTGTNGDYYGCYSNSFGNDCYSNTFGNNCSSNSFGNDCYSNSFGNNCSSNTFGNYCYSNTFGNYYYSNTSGNNCSSNSFGNDCYSNTFGNDCCYNVFGDDYFSNTFGNDCSYNIISYSGAGVFEDLKSFVHDSVRYNTFDNGCSFNNICYQESGYLQNYHITAGVCGQRANSMNVISFNTQYVTDSAFKTTIAKRSDGNIVIYNEADLVPWTYIT